MIAVAAAPLLIGVVGAFIGLLTLYGFILAARAYGKAKSVEVVAETNTLLITEVAAVKQALARRDEELSKANADISSSQDEIERLQARTDVRPFFDTFATNNERRHKETIHLLARIANESETRNGKIEEMLVDINNLLRKDRP